MTTPYHAKYFAHEITRIGSDGIERLGRSLFDASVDLNPHQIEAALFALRSPIRKGVLLADEVGDVKEMRRIVKGETPVTADIAQRMERVLGVPASFWENLEQQYRG